MDRAASEVYKNSGAPDDTTITQSSSAEAEESPENHTKHPYIHAQALCLKSLINRGVLVENDLSRYSEPFSEVFRRGIFDASKIDESQLEAGFQRLPAEDKAIYEESKASMASYLVGEGIIANDSSDFTSKGYEKALKVFFCGDLKTIETLQAGHPNKIAQKEEEAIIQADPELLS